MKDITNDAETTSLFVPAEKYTVETASFTHDGINKKFLLASQIMTNVEREQLKRYCQCSNCKKYIKIPFVTIGCPCCVGCLSQDGDRQYVINETKNYIKNNYKPNTSFSFFSFFSGAS